MKLKPLVTQYHGFLTDISGFVTAGLIFACGIGRYRSVVVYAAYCLLKSPSNIFNIEKRLNMFFLPAVVVALFFDVTKGPIFPLLTFNHLLIALPVMIILDKVVRNLIERMIGNISDGELFIVCPSCNYDNEELVKTCIKCAYDITKTVNKKLTNISSSYKGDKIPSQLISLLNIGESETILFHKQLSLRLACFKNNVRILRKHFIITSSYLILIDYKGFSFHIPKSYREKDIIPLTEIEVIKCEMKNIDMTNRPFLEIKTFGEVIFGVAFSCFGDYRGEMEEIVNLIKKANRQAKTVFDLSDMSWKYNL